MQVQPPSSAPTNAPPKSGAAAIKNGWTHNEPIVVHTPVIAPVSIINATMNDISEVQLNKEENRSGVLNHLCGPDVPHWGITLTLLLQLTLRYDIWQLSYNQLPTPSEHFVCIFNLAIPLSVRYDILRIKYAYRKGNDLLHCMYCAAHGIKPAKQLLHFILIINKEFHLWVHV